MTVKSVANKIGRPTDYNEEIANIICDRVATHACGLKKICKMYDDLPHPDTINLWRHKHPEFSVQYALAKLRQADLLAEECLDIADDDSKDKIIDETTGNEVCNTEFIARSRLRIDTRKWLASKLLPKQYGAMVDEKKSSTEALVDKLIDKLID